jgi:hypothetical protein
MKPLTTFVFAITAWIGAIHGASAGNVTCEVEANKAEKGGYQAILSGTSTNAEAAYREAMRKCTRPGANTYYRLGCHLKSSSPECKTAAHNADSLNAVGNPSPQAGGKTAGIL